MSKRQTQPAELRSTYRDGEIVYVRGEGYSAYYAGEPLGCRKLRSAAEALIDDARETLARLAYAASVTA